MATGTEHRSSLLTLVVTDSIQWKITQHSSASPTSKEHRETSILATDGRETSTLSNALNLKTTNELYNRPQSDLGYTTKSSISEFLESGSSEVKSVDVETTHLETVSTAILQNADVSARGETSIRKLAYKEDPPVEGSATEQDQDESPDNSTMTSLLTSQYEHYKVTVSMQYSATNSKNDHTSDVSLLKRTTGILYYRSRAQKRDNEDVTDEAFVAEGNQTTVTSPPTDYSTEAGRNDTTFTVPEDGMASRISLTTDPGDNEDGKEFTGQFIVGIINRRILLFYGHLRTRGKLNEQNDL